MVARVVCVSFLLLLSLVLSSAGRDGNFVDSNTSENEQSEAGFHGSVGGHIGVDVPGVSIGGNVGGSIDVSGGGCGSNCGGGCSSGNCNYPPPNCNGGCNNCPVNGCPPVMPMPPYYYNQPLYCVPATCPTNQCAAVTLQFSEVASAEVIMPPTASPSESLEP